MATRLERWKGCIKTRIRHGIIVAMRILPINNRKVLFLNFNGLGYGESPKYIAKQFLQSDQPYECIWLLKDKSKNNLPENIRVVFMETIRSYYEIATAKVWVSDTRLPLYFTKRKKQYYVQTWHGGVGFKKAEKAAEDKLSKNYLKAAKHDSKMANLFLSNGKERTRLYRENFWYDGEILECGFPKNDVLINNACDKEAIRKKVGIVNPNARLILYAPTFRDDNNELWRDLDFDMVIHKFEERFKGTWEVLVRLHPNVPADSVEKVTNNRVHNASNYGDISEILCISDVLISDYSSIIIDMSMVGKKVFLYIPDKVLYENNRGMKYRVEELPYPKAESNQELAKVIAEYEDTKYETGISKFMEQFGFEESGHAAEIVYHKLCGEMR